MNLHTVFIGQQILWANKTNEVFVFDKNKTVVLHKPYLTHLTFSR